jgi:hypothetical protein
MFFFARPGEKEHSKIGLSLAGHFQFFLYRFFARRGEKTIQNNDKVPHKP